VSHVLEDKGKSSNSVRYLLLTFSSLEMDVTIFSQSQISLTFDENLLCV
jgi:hypothetical protein